MELKPCPFCGGEATEKNAMSYFVFWVQCKVCEAEGPTEVSRTRAIEGWNRRTVIDGGK